MKETSRRMERPDIKKLISGFLVLATIGGILAFVFSNFDLTLSSEKNPAKEILPRNAIPQNAFVEPLPQFPLPSESGEADEEGAFLEIPATSNFTDRLAYTLARELIRANPEGPVTENNSRVLLSPDLDAALEQTKESAGAIETLAAELEPAIPENAIRAMRGSDLGDNGEYLAALDQIFEENFVHPDLSERLKEDLSLVMLNNVEGVLDDAFLDAKKLTVPETFVPLHKQFLALLDTQRKMASLASGDDPLAAYLAIKNREERYEATLRDFARALGSAQTLLENPEEKTAHDSFFRSIFGIRAAYAIGGLGDIVFDPAIFGIDLKNFLLNVLVSAVKTQMVDRMTNQIVNWIQGGGKPQFLSDWKGFLQNSANRVAGSLVDAFAPGLCSSFGPQLTARLRLSLPGTRLLQSPTQCTLDEVVSNIKEFGRDFRQGGWLAYGRILQPNNNYFGAQILLGDAIALETERQREADVAEGQSNQGFISTKLCVAPQPVDPDYNITIEEIRGQEGYIPGSEAGCKNLGDGVKVCDTYKVCDPNGWRTTTPGSAISATTQRALTASYDSIIGANNVEAIISAFVNAAINKVIASGPTGLAGSSYAGQARRRGGGGAPQTPQGTFLGEAYAILGNKEETLGIYDQEIDIIRTALKNLEDAIAACTLEVQEATNNGNTERVTRFQNRLDVAEKREVALLPRLPDLEARREALAPNVENLKIFIDEVQNISDPNYEEGLNDLQARFGTSEDSEEELRDAEDEYADLQRKAFEAQQSLDRCTPQE